MPPRRHLPSSPTPPPPPSPSPPHPDSARLRLLDAAEQLFGERGIHSTSLRDLTAEANANIAAVNYHFGTKEGLVAAVLARRAEPINRQREELLDRLLADPSAQPPSIEAVLHAFVDPAFVLHDSNAAFLKFVARLWQEPEPAYRKIIMRQFAQTVRRFLEVLHHLLPGLSMADLWLRFTFCVGAMLLTWTSNREAATFFHLADANASARSLADQWVAFTAAGFRAAPVGKSMENPA